MGTGAEPRRWRLRAAHSTLSGVRAWPIVVGGPMAQNEQERLRRIETAARRLIEVDTTDAEAGPEFDSMWVRLRAALGEPSNA